MQHFPTSGKRSMFNVVGTSKLAQAALMTLEPGQSSSEKAEDEHSKSEQWLFVIKGRGRATVGRRRIGLRGGSLLIIERNERHKITASRNGSLVTVNLHVPPAYSKDGAVLPRAKRARSGGG